MQAHDFVEKIEQVFANWGYILVFLSTLIETSPLGFIIPGSLIVALGGFFAYGNKIAIAGIIVSGSLGMLSTFLLAYLIGKKTGFSLVKKIHQEKHAKTAKKLLENNGPIILTTSLLASLTRFWVSYAAGSQKYNFWKFLFYSSAASLTWCSLFASVGYLAGSERQQLESGIAKLGILSWGLIFIAIGVIYIKTKKEIKEMHEETDSKKKF